MPGAGISSGTTLRSTDSTERATSTAAWASSGCASTTSTASGSTSCAPTRRERIQAALSASGLWDGYAKTIRPGFQDMAQAVTYVASHDVEQAPRFVNHPEFVFPWWPWAAVEEHGAGTRGAPIRNTPGQSAMSTSLAPFQVRVFST